ncbi:MAG: tRNA (adenosine(37)-N6)-threonylcarbamoyltransferase complex dimerization subunit type 1 TsaB [Nocardioides sp.]
MLLALDTATPLVTVALHDGDRVLVERVGDVSMKHAEQLAPLIDVVLHDAGCVPTRLTGIAVGTGPGPFTGLRVGLVTARTLGHALGVPVRGVCTLDVIAAEAARIAPAEPVSGAHPGFVVATDARRREVYSATYDAAGRRTGEPRVTKPMAVATDQPVAGEGAVLYPEAFPRAFGPVRPSAGWLAQVVVGGLAAVTEPKPLYLRRPDAVVPGVPKRVS